MRLLQDRDLWFGLCVAGFGLFFDGYIGRQPWARFSAGELIGPALFPRLLSNLMTVFGLWLAVVQLVGWWRGSATPAYSNRLLTSEAVLILASGFLYVVLLPAAGFLLATFIFLVVLSLYWGARARLRTLVVCCVAPLLILIIATRFLGMELPMGFFEKWIGLAG